MYLIEVKGTKSILPLDCYLWDYIINIVKNRSFFYGYKNLNTPILEYKKLYSISLGNYSGILEKEIYSFILNNKFLCLKPENTTSVMKIFLKYRLYSSDLYFKFFYISKIFRHDKPQFNRYREFHQIGLEILNNKRFFCDLELIFFCEDIFIYLNIKKYVLLNINNIGSYEDIYFYKISLIKYFLKNIKIFFFNKKYIFKIFKNPLSFLDEKNYNFYFILKKSPKIYNFLNISSFKKIEKIKFLLKKKNIFFFFNKNLVRGLSYYNDFVFEWVDKFYNFNSLIGGGRYNFLSKKFCYIKINSVGLSIGLERVLSLYKKNNIFLLYDFDVIFIYLNKKKQLKSFYYYYKLLSFDIKCFLIYLNNCYLLKNLFFINSKYFIFMDNFYFKNNIIFLLYNEILFNKKNYKVFIKKLLFFQIKNFFLSYKSKI